ncbi:MAG: DUF58 domain-containing protein [Methylobacteriaceae bacterium]|nr:DUF58 domain-containing protein [Methylobacteriaceae bacterium]
MADARLLAADEAKLASRHNRGALSLARRLPQLVVAAKQVASTVMHGVHGRRRAGVGESFWQFRPFAHGESAQRIDWRRSARDDRLYVRERELETAHTVMIWIDRSPSMAYVSSLARESKLDRALILGMAAADLLVRGGERVGFPGLMRPIAHRAVVDKIAEAMITQERIAPDVAQAELPPADPLPARAQAVVVGDLLSSPHDIGVAVEAMSGRGARGHVVMIADPVEETFPFAGHTEFLDVDSPARLRLGEAASLRETYLTRLAAHREAIRAISATHGWSFALHRTDRPASEALLALRVQLEGAGVFLHGSGR